MADMREIGQIIGEALVSIKTRVLALEEAELKPVEPPVVQITIPEQEPISIDLTALVEAVTNASVGDKLEAMGDKLAEASIASSEAQEAFQQVIVDLAAVVNVQQQQIGDLTKSLDDMGSRIVAVLASPKELTFDDDGEPVGVVVTQKQLN